MILNIILFELLVKKIMIQVYNNYFHIITSNSSYIMRVLPNGTLSHCYYGKRLSNINIDDFHLFIPHDYTAPVDLGGAISTNDAIPQECSSFGRGDYRTPAIIIESHDGRIVSDFKYSKYRHYSGVADFPGLPNLDYNAFDAETLEIVLKDTVTNANIYLYYTVFEDIDIIARHVRIKNYNSKSITIRKAMSASFDFETSDFDIISLNGRWACERSIERVPIHHGKTSFSSNRGATGHHSTPFIALSQKNADEVYGDVYAMTLVYSGNFEVGVDVGQLGGTRVFAGINSETFSWKLKEEEEFITPQAILTYSSNGFGQISHNFHEACRQHLGACARNKKHPIVLNLWEAFYFDVDEEKVINSIRAIKGLGIDTVVLDDGWFGNRKSDKNSLGDWYVNENKFPNGLNAIIEECKANDLKFGLWFEPEMISEDSELYREHPDWCVHIDDIQPVKSRNELVLDFSRQEVVDGIYKIISKVLKKNDISYVKWDMNRNVTDNGSQKLPADRQGEHSHRCILGIYSLMNKLTEKFPNVYFEGSAGGGGRFDYGILYYMPQIWTSDNSDAIARLKIQYGTSLLFPPESMSAHVSDCPNHQTGRITPLKSRGEVALLFSLGYEFDPEIITADMRELIVAQIGQHREYEEWLYDSKYYRLINPFDTNKCAWQMVSKDKTCSVVLYAMQLSEANRCGEYLRLKGLDPKKKYIVKQMQIEATGDILMDFGIPIRDIFNDFDTLLLDVVEKV